MFGVALVESSQTTTDRRNAALPTPGENTIAELEWRMKMDVFRIYYDCGGSFAAFNGRKT